MVLQHFFVSNQWQLYATPNPGCILSFIQCHRCTEGVQQDQRNCSMSEVQHTMEEKPLIDWDAGLFDCFEEVNTCCYGFWCSPCLACTVSRGFGENTCLPLCDILTSAASAICGMPGCVPPAALSVRAAMRNKYGIKGSLCKDIAVSCFCVLCSWCQMHRELKHRKKTPTIINIQNNPVINVQPIPVAQPPVMMVPGQPPPPGFVAQPGVVVGSY